MVSLDLTCQTSPKPQASASCGLTNDVKTIIQARFNTLLGKNDTSQKKKND